MTGTAAEETEIAGVLLQAFAEVPLPDAVNCNTGEEGVVLVSQPADEPFAEAVAEVEIGGLEGEAGLDGLVLFRFPSRF